jgi:hypothetical protein
MRAAFALFVGLLIIINLLGDLLSPGFDGNLWWISFGDLPAWLSRSLLAVSAFALVAFAFRPPARSGRSLFTAGLALLLAGAAAMNALTFYRLLATSRIAAGFPVPFSLLICVGMLLVARAAWAQRESETRVAAWRAFAGCLGLFAAFPLALMVFFGNTDYRRPADAVVVFGARAYKCPMRLKIACARRASFTAPAWRSASCSQAGPATERSMKPKPCAATPSNTACARKIFLRTPTV